MSAPRKVYQIVTTDAGPGGTYLYARLDNGELWRYLDRFDDSLSRSQWVRIPDPPGVKPFDGDNGAPDSDEPRARRRY